MSVSTPQNATLIDTLSEGYRTINRRPWLMLVPILLNVYFWFGTPVSFQPLFSDLYGLVQEFQKSAPQPSELQPAYAGLLEFGKLDMRAPLAVLNFVPTLVGSGGLGLAFAQPPPPTIDPQRSDTIQIGSLAGAALFFLLINIIALPISTVFLTWLAAAVRGDHAPLGVWLRRVARAGLSIVGYVALLVGVLLALGIPLGMAASLLFVASPALGLLAIVVLQAPVFWATIYSGFAPEAIVVSGIGPVQALRASIQIVRRNFWGTLGLLALTLVVSLGTSVIWQQITGSTAGVVVAIIGSAYIGSGLLAARMAFYRERLRQWHGQK